jgi:hypothetical protein
MIIRIGFPAGFADCKAKQYVLVSLLFAFSEFSIFWVLQCRSTVGMWHTLAELVYNTTIPGIGEQVRINLPPLLRAHLDALVVQVSLCSK